jgi:CDP-glucose 4,6-dehydratase
MAAQPLVRKSYLTPIDTWNTNVIGTLNLLESLKKLKKKCAVIVITTDKVYQNNEWIYGYRESDRLGGKDPYSSSKAAVELVIDSWRSSFCGNLEHQQNNIGIASVRAGNVIGGGDWAVDRLIPDIIKARYENKSINIRNPYSKRPWQHVLDPLCGYMNLAENLYNENNFVSSCLCSAFNIGPNIESNKSVIDVINKISEYIKIDYDFDVKEESLYESTLLHLNTDKISSYLDWTPVWGFDKSIESTGNWYKNYYENKEDAFEICKKDIENFLY